MSAFDNNGWGFTIGVGPLSYTYYVMSFADGETYSYSAGGLGFSAGVVGAWGSLIGCNDCTPESLEGLFGDFDLTLGLGIGISSTPDGSTTVASANLGLGLAYGGSYTFMNRDELGADMGLPYDPSVYDGSLMETMNTIYNSLRNQGDTDDGLSDTQKAAYTNKIRAQTETIDAVNTDYSFNLASKISVSDLVRNSNNNSSNSDPRAGHNHSSTVGQNNSQLDRGLDALNTVGSGIDLDAVQNTNTINFTPRVSDMDTGGIGGGLLQPIVIDLDWDGIEILSRYNSPVRADIDGDGFLERASWVGADDGILVIDLAADGTGGGNGVIIQGKEFVFTLWGAEDQYATDLAALLGEFDSNNDGVFSALDARWGEFRLAA